MEGLIWIGIGIWMLVQTAIDIALFPILAIISIFDRGHLRKRYFSIRRKNKRDDC